MRVWCVVVVAVVGIIKSIDLGAALFVMARPHSRAAGRLSGGRHFADPTWTPVFSMSRSLRKDHKSLDLPLSILLDIGFRAPILSFLQAAVLLWLTGTVHLSGSRVHGSLEVFSIVGAATAVVGSAGTIVFLLAVKLLARTDEVRRHAGQTWTRSGRRGSGGPTIDSVLVVPAMTVALVMAYAALYLTIYASSHALLQTHGHPFGPIDAVYFSVVTATTVGFGDITPASHGGELLVVSQILATATGLALFVTTLVASEGSPANSVRRSRNRRR